VNGDRNDGSAGTASVVAEASSSGRTPEKLATPRVEKAATSRPSAQASGKIMRTGFHEGRNSGASSSIGRKAKHVDADLKRAVKAERQEDVTNKTSAGSLRNSAHRRVVVESQSRRSRRKELVVDVKKLTSPQLRQTSFQGEQIPSKRKRHDALEPTNLGSSRLADVARDDRRHVAKRIRLAEGAGTQKTRRHSVEGVHGQYMNKNSKQATAAPSDAQVSSYAHIGRNLNEDEELILAVLRELNSSHREPSTSPQTTRKRAFRELSETSEDQGYGMRSFGGSCCDQVDVQHAATQDLEMNAIQTLKQVESDLLMMGNRRSSNSWRCQPENNENQKYMRQSRSQGVGAKGDGVHINSEALGSSSSRAECSEPVPEWQQQAHEVRHFVPEENAEIAMHNIEGHVLRTEAKRLGQQYDFIFLQDIDVSSPEKKEHCRARRAIGRSARAGIRTPDQLEDHVSCDSLCAEAARQSAPVFAHQDEDPAGREGREENPGMCTQAANKPELNLAERNAVGERASEQRDDFEGSVKELGQSRQELQLCCQEMQGCSDRGQQRAQGVNECAEESSCEEEEMVPRQEMQEYSEKEGPILSVKGESYGQDIKCPHNGTHGNRTDGGGPDVDRKETRDVGGSVPNDQNKGFVENVDAQVQALSAERAQQSEVANEFGAEMHMGERGGVLGHGERAHERVEDVEDVGGQRCSDDREDGQGNDAQAHEQSGEAHQRSGELHARGVDVQEQPVEKRSEEAHDPDAHTQGDKERSAQAHCDSGEIQGLEGGGKEGSGHMHDMRSEELRTESEDGHGYDDLTLSHIESVHGTHSVGGKENVFTHGAGKMLQEADAEIVHNFVVGEGHCETVPCRSEDEDDMCNIAQDELRRDRFPFTVFSVSTPQTRTPSGECS
jgi:hypothetical protein